MLLEVEALYGDKVGSLGVSGNIDQMLREMGPSVCGSAPHHILHTSLYLKIPTLALPAYLSLRKNGKSLLYLRWSVSCFLIQPPVPECGCS